jgi:hypothetical protein
MPNCVTHPNQNQTHLNDNTLMKLHHNTLEPPLPLALHTNSNIWLFDHRVVAGQSVEKRKKKKKSAV